MNLDNPTIVPSPDMQVLSGDMFPPTISTDPTTQPGQQPAGQATPAPAIDPQRIVIGDKVFNSTEAAIAYAEGLDKARESFSRNTLPAQEVPAQPAQTKKPGTLIFEDPDQALADVENRAVARMEENQRKIDADRKFWEDFRRTYPDLVGAELMVDAVLAREQSLGTIRNLSREQAAPILAAKARQEVSKIRNVPSGGQALPSSPAVVAGASGTSTPKPATPQPEATNFIAELRGIRKRG